MAQIRDMKQTHPSSTRRKAVHGGSTPASMRVMVVDKCDRFISLAVNETAVIKNDGYSSFRYLKKEFFFVGYVYLIVIQYESLPDK